MGLTRPEGQGAAAEEAELVAAGEGIGLESLTYRALQSRANVLKDQAGAVQETANVEVELRQISIEGDTDAEEGIRVSARLEEAERFALAADIRAAHLNSELEQSKLLAQRLQLRVDSLLSAVSAKDKECESLRTLASEARTGREREVAALLVQRDELADRMHEASDTVARLGIKLEQVGDERRASLDLIKVLEERAEAERLDAASRIHDCESQLTEAHHLLEEHARMHIEQASAAREAIQQRDDCAERIEQDAKTLMDLRKQLTQMRMSHDQVLSSAEVRETQLLSQLRDAEWQIDSLKGRLQERDEQVADSRSRRVELASVLQESTELRGQIAAQAATIHELRSVIRQLESKEAAQSAVAAKLTSSLAVARGKLLSAELRGAERERRRTALLREALASSLADGQMLMRELEGIRASRSYRCLRWVKDLRMDSRAGEVLPVTVVPGVSPEEYVAVLTSGLWDADWYIANYPDVADSGVDPFRHFLLQGWLEGRDPGPSFSTLDFLQAGTGSVAEHSNPMVDYLITRRSALVESAKQGGSDA